MDQLTIQEAREFVENWRNLPSAQKGEAIDDLKAWLIPHEVVQSLFNDGAYAIRTYLGYDVNNSEVKLIIVGTSPKTNGIYKDIINLDETQETKIYNFTQTCPPGCDIDSSLF